MFLYLVWYIFQSYFRILLLQQTVSELEVSRRFGNHTRILLRMSQRTIKWANYTIICRYNIIFLYCNLMTPLLIIHNWRIELQMGFSYFLRSRWFQTRFVVGAIDNREKSWGFRNTRFRFNWFKIKNHKTNSKWWFWNLFGVERLNTIL